jgi:hypothetical protein
MVKARVRPEGSMKEAAVKEVRMATDAYVMRLEAPVETSVEAWATKVPWTMTIEVPRAAEMTAAVEVATTIEVTTAIEVTTTGVATTATEVTATATTHVATATESTSSKSTTTHVTATTAGAGGKHWGGHSEDDG